MNQQDWEEYFQAVNGRAASADEVSEALKKGEFSADQPAVPEAAPAVAPVVQPAPVPAPAAAPAPPLVAGACANCGSALAPGDVFCANCGTPAPVASPAPPVAAVAPPVAAVPAPGAVPMYPGAPAPAPVPPGAPTPGAPTAPPTPFTQTPEYAAVKNGAANLWAWVLSALKSPFNGAEANDKLWFGWVAVILSSIFGALVPATLAWKSVSQLYQTGSSFLNNFDGGLFSSLGGGGLSSLAGSTNSAITSLFFMLCLGLLIIHFAVILGGLLVKRNILGDVTYTFRRAMNEYGRMYVLVLAVIVVSELFALLGISAFVVLLNVVSYVLFAFIFSFGVVHPVTEKAGDVFYRKLGGYAAASAILAVGIFLAALMLGNRLASIITSIL